MAVLMQTRKRLRPSACVCARVCVHGHGESVEAQTPPTLWTSPAAGAWGGLPLARSSGWNEHTTTKLLLTWPC